MPAKTNQFIPCNVIMKTVRQAVINIVVLSFLAVTVFAQAPALPAARPDRGVGLPGSYSISDIENINLTNGNVNLSIPLASLPPIAGGKLSWMVKANYSSKLWNMRSEQEIPDSYHSTPYVTQRLEVSSEGGWRIGGIYQIYEQSSDEELPFSGCTGSCIDETFRYKYFLVMPDGARHELRPLDASRYTGSQSWRHGYYATSPNTIGATMRYYSLDGSYLWATVNPFGQADRWTLYLPDGLRVVQQSDGIQRIYDTNGNKIKIYSEGDPLGVTTTHYVDEQTEREIKVIADAELGRRYVQYQTVGGGWATIDIIYGATSVQGLRYNINDRTCPDVAFGVEGLYYVSEIVLPQTEAGAPRRRFTFQYNSDILDFVNFQYRSACGAPLTTVTTASHGWGSLNKVIMPSGAEVEYDYSLDGPNSYNPFPPTSPLSLGRAKAVPGEVITQKRVKHGGQTDTWTYQIGIGGAESVVNGPDGSTEIVTYYPIDPADASYVGNSQGKNGLVYISERYGTGTSSKIIVERQWGHKIFDGAHTNAPSGVAVFNPVVDTEYTTLAENGQLIKMSAKKFQYDFNGNITQTTEYDWFDPALVTRDSNGVPIDVPAGAVVLRTTTASYHNPATTSNSGNVYAKRAIAAPTPLILDAPQQTITGPSQTQFSYDNQGYGAAPTLGNLTQVSKWDDQAGAWRNTTYGHDSYGNRTTVTDPNNNVTTIVYDTATHAQPTEVRVDPLNGTGTQTATTVYDYSTGSVTSVTDPNNQITSTGYINHRLGAVDPLGRPGEVTGAPVNSVVGGVTYPNQQRKVKTTYYDDLRQVVAESDLNQTGDYKFKARTSYDQLGRVVKTENNEDGTANYTISAQTVYIQMGLITLTSNPKRGAAATTDGWIRTTRDALGRVTGVATFLGATQPPTIGTNGNWTGLVTTSFYANQTTVTDQAGKMRRSVTDGLGRLGQVVEDPNGLNYQTNYFYDTLGNLRKVEQGVQSRWFAYDSLSRLIYAMNPEQTANPAFVYTDNAVAPGNSQWSMKYAYQPNGNLATRVDARNVTTTYGYDGLNRNTTVDYDNTPAINPDIARTYDTATLGKGRLRKTETTNGTRVTINAYDATGRTLSQSQQFYHLGAWGASYTMQQTYNLTGGATSQTYPSGHSTTTNYDAAGRVNTFGGNLGTGGTPTNYVTGTTVYTATGQMTQEQFGTGTTLYHRRHFTSHGQMYDVRLGTGAADDFSNATWNRGGLRTFYSSNLVEYNSPPTGQQNNNGNVYRQDHFAPLNDAASDWVMSVDNYSYDALNRITGVSEAADSYIGSVFQETFPYAQYFNYDRYGNRTLISATSTATSGAGATSIKDTVWVEDSLPAGATVGSDGGDGWTWVSGNPSPVSGNSAHQSNVAAGMHQHFFYGATATLPVNTGDKLYAYVYLDPANMPSEVMLQWNENGNWEHRAYWGANLIAWGVDGTASRRNMGALPPNGGWMRLEVPASLVGLEGKTLNGMAFTLYGGRATWDRAGKSAPQTGGSINNLPINVDPARNRLLAVSGTMQYDAAGNLSYDNYTTPLLGQRNYDAENRMTAVYNNTGVLQDSYYYDGDGRRTRRVIVGVETWQIYGIGGELVAEYAAGGATNAPQKEYGYRDGQLLITAESNGTVKWLVQDQLGSTRMVVDKSGALNGANGIVRHDYLPFGEEVSAGVGIRSTSSGYGTDTLRQKFGSKERDTETGLDYFLARYYSSIQGCFTSPDEFQGGPRELFVLGGGSPTKQALPYADITNPQSLNKYVYTYNNPLRYIDPDGHMPDGDGLLDQFSKYIRVLAAALGLGDPVVEDQDAQTIINNRLPGGRTVGDVVRKDVIPAQQQTIENLQAIGELIDPTGGLASAAIGRAAGVRDNKDVVFAAAGTITQVAGIKGFTGHAIDRIIERVVKPAAILDALKSPLQTGKVIYDKLGRPSQRIVGRTAEVVINPETKVVVSVNPTSTKKAKRLLKRLEDNQ